MADEFEGLFDRTLDEIHSSPVNKNIAPSSTDPIKDDDFDPDSIIINKSFADALDAINAGLSVFITGAAGSGKSTLIKYIKHMLRKKLAIIAPTGIASTNVGGQTIHSFFKLPPKLITPDSIQVDDFKANLYKALDVIIIDEISMVRVDMLDVIDAFLKKARRNPLPFGGVQMILVGDLHQLPPVVADPHELSYLMSHYQSIYFFDSNVVKRNPLIKVELETIYRQSDKLFLDLLSRMKRNTMTNEDYQIINSKCYRRVDENDKSVFHICTTNATSDKINARFLNSIKNESHIFRAEIEGNFNPKNTIMQEILELKVGAKVMMLNNDPERRWSNGTLAHIHNIDKTGVWIEIDDNIYQAYKVTVDSIKYDFDFKSKGIKSSTTGSFTQYGMKLSYATTVHKAQGQTLERINIDLSSKMFAHGQLYVAFSRCKTLEGISINNPIGPADVKFDTDIKNYLYPDNTTSDGKQIDDLPF